MKNIKTVYSENNKPITVEIFFSFEIEELNKSYIVYSVNDDDINEDVNVLISEIHDNRIVSIPEKEKEMVLLFYENIKDNLKK
jgi:uncharacterized protein YrzB (UPF0473 family)